MPNQTVNSGKELIFTPKPNKQAVYYTCIKCHSDHYRYDAEHVEQQTRAHASTHESPAQEHGEGDTTCRSLE
jgi:hypothetical protein